jgi:hypothetical protein
MARNQRRAATVFSQSGNTERVLFVLDGVVARIERVHLAQRRIVIHGIQDPRIADCSPTGESHLSQSRGERGIGSVTAVP